MKTLKIFTPVFVAILLTASAFAQQNLIKRTTYKNDRFEFGVGGTLSVIGAPKGSIRVEGWSNREVEISAEITVEAATEADLDRISKVTGFISDESVGSINIVSIGTHDVKYLKKADKKFPKTLLGLPFSISYVIKVPRYCDLQIDGGKGALHVSGVEGRLKLNYLESDAVVELIGGSVTATIGVGKLDMTIASRSWRGHFADVQLAKGEMNINLPTGLNADLDANILRSGKIDNGFAGLKPKERKVEFTEKSIAGKSGTGSIPLKFTVGDGTMTIKEIGKPS